MATKKSPSPLPSATIYGANISEFVAWDGQRYVLRPTRDSVLADDSLRLIGSVRELSRFTRRSPGYVFTPNPSEHVCSPRNTSEAQPGISVVAEDAGSDQPKKRRLTPSIDCPKAARRLERYLSEHGIGLNKFSLAIGTNEEDPLSLQKIGESASGYIRGHSQGNEDHQRRSIKFLIDKPL
jgi:hypothetical protein